jgi:uroporphyrinogen-III synthase
MRVVVTRPVREAQRWALELRRHGIDAVELPLIEIGPAGDDGAVRAAWGRLATYDAVMFVSGNAADRFFRLRPDLQARWPDAVRAWAPGPGTVDALLAAGVPQSAIDQPSGDAGQYDSEALWDQVADQLHAGQRVLVVRGGNLAGQGSGRDWLGGQLQARGVAVDHVIAYSRQPPAWSGVECARARECASDGAVWLFSSSEAIAHLLALLPQQRWGPARAVATHPRIRQTALDAGFGTVQLSRPALADVVASIESMR